MTTPERGDLVECRWLDTVTGDGSPDSAQLALRTTFAIFWKMTRSHDNDCVVLTNTIDTDVTDQQGYFIYPLANIVELKVIKRARRARSKRHDKPNEPPPQ